MMEMPVSSNTCQLALIDTTCDIVINTTALLEPEIRGHELLNLPTFAFYIYNPRQDKRVLFDMGARSDWWNLPPAVVSAIRAKGIVGLRITKDVDQVLAAGGVDPATIDAVVWSHFHWDHVGNIQRFPSSTSVVVGTGFKKAFLPGYPASPTSPFFEADFAGRQLHEIAFDDDGGDGRSLKIGPFKAHDYFGDGSFYILNTPGHTVGHVSGLVRTTPTTFVFLGGDISHFPGAYRPSVHIPMPDVLPAETQLDDRLPSPCPCALFTACHPAGLEKAQTTPFYRPSTHPESWYDNVADAQKSIDGLIQYDADSNIFVAIAHDPALREVCLSFPAATMNDWQVSGWKPRSHWNFLNEMPIGGEPGRPKLVEGRLSA